MLLVKSTRQLVKTTRPFSTIFAVMLCKYLFYFIHLFLLTDTYVKVSIRQPQCFNTVVYLHSLCRKSEIYL